MAVRGGYLLQLGQVPYREAWELQRALAGAVSQGAVPDTVILLEHPPVVTLGRRTDEDSELHIPATANVELIETDRGGKSTFHGPGQLVCYPIIDLKRHGRDVKQYVRNLEEALIRTVEPFGLAAERIDGLTGAWLTRHGRRGASACGRGARGRVRPRARGAPGRRGHWPLVAARALPARGALTGAAKVTLLRGFRHGAWHRAAPGTVLLRAFGPRRD